MGHRNQTSSWIKEIKGTIVFMFILLSKQLNSIGTRFEWRIFLGILGRFHPEVVPTQTKQIFTKQRLIIFYLLCFWMSYRIHLFSFLNRISCTFDPFLSEHLSTCCLPHFYFYWILEVIFKVNLLSFARSCEKLVKLVLFPRSVETQVEAMVAGQ